MRMVDTMATFFLKDHPNHNYTQYREDRRNNAVPTGTFGVHTTESFPDWVGPDTGAENVAGYITRRDTPGSYHGLSDSDSNVVLAHGDWEVWSDRFTNNYQYSVSAATQAAKWLEATPEWREATIKNMARLFADEAKRLKEKYGIDVPARRLTREEAHARKPGFYAHGDSDPGRRTDPGEHFDWNLLLETYADLMELDDIELVMPYFVNPAVGRISSNYGWRVHPVTGQRDNFHRGIDIANKVGTPIYAAFAGTVRYVRDDSYPGDKRPNDVTGYYNTGKAILVDGPGGGSEWYGHLDEIFVKEGQEVRVGQQIGTMGETGNVTGPHLHFETWRNRSDESHADPRGTFVYYGVTPGVGTPPVIAITPPSVSKPSTTKTHTHSDRSWAPGEVLRLQQILRTTGDYKGAMDDRYGRYMEAAVKSFQTRQKFPDLVIDGDWGPGMEKHYQWTLDLQDALNAWSAVKRIGGVGVDGDYGSVTHNAVYVVQRDNKGGAYKGVVDRIPGAVTCKMLGIPTHPLV